MFLLKIFTNLWFDGRCLLINLMNILPILVLTDLPYGGLNQIMLRFLFFLFCFLLIVDIVAWFYILGFICFLGIFHGKRQTSGKYFLMMIKLRVFFNWLWNFFNDWWRVAWIDMNIFGFFVGFSVRAVWTNV